MFQSWGRHRCDTTMCDHISQCIRTSQVRNATQCSANKIIDKILHHTRIPHSSPSFFLLYRFYAHRFANIPTINGNNTTANKCDRIGSTGIRSPTATHEHKNRARQYWTIRAIRCKIIWYAHSDSTQKIYTHSYRDIDVKWLTFEGLSLRASNAANDDKR